MHNEAGFRAEPKNPMQFRRRGARKGLAMNRFGFGHRHAIPQPADVNAMRLSLGEVISSGSPEAGKWELS